MSAATRDQGSLRAPLENRNFRLLWIGQGVSALGNSMYKVTLAWGVYSITGSAADMGIVLAANIIPQLALIMLGGAIGDRMSQRAILVTTDSTAAIITGALAWATWFGSPSIFAVVAASFGLGVVSAFFGPAQYPVIRHSLPVEHQQAASAIYSATFTVASVLGPLLASLVFAVADVSAGFAIDAGTFAFAAACSWLIRLERLKIEEPQSMLGDVRDGFRYVTSTVWLRICVLLSVTANVLCLAPFYVLLPDVVKNASAGAERLGLLVGVQSAATAAAAMATGKYAHRFPRGPHLYALAGITGLAIALVGAVSPTAPAMFLAMALLGLGLSFNVVETAMIQERVKPQYLARVHSVNTAASFSLAPVGYGAAGALGDHFGGSAVLIGGGIAFLAVTSIAALSTRLRLDDLDHPGTVGSFSSAP